MAGAGVVAEALKRVSVAPVLLSASKFLKWDDVSLFYLSNIILLTLLSPEYEFHQKVMFVFVVLEKFYTN